MEEFANNIDRERITWGPTVVPWTRAYGNHLQSSKLMAGNIDSPNHFSLRVEGIKESHPESSSSNSDSAAS